jgi:hypothetical protein
MKRFLIASLLSMFVSSHAFAAGDFTPTEDESAAIEVPAEALTADADSTTETTLAANAQHEQTAAEEQPAEITADAGDTNTAADEPVALAVDDESGQEQFTETASIATEELDRTRGAGISNSVFQTAQLTAILSGNTPNGGHENAVSNASGLNVVIQNSGNNVAILNSVELTVSFQ